MGRVRTKTVKKAAKVLIEKYFTKLTGDFHTNKKILNDVSVISTKRLRNKIAGFATHLMKRIQVGPVRGISLKIQEEQRERRLEKAPEHSKVDILNVPVDEETMKMLEKIGMNGLTGFQLQEPVVVPRQKRQVKQE